MTLPVLRSQATPAMYGPLHDFARLHQRMSDLLSTVLDTDPRSATGSAWTPFADVTEADDAYLLEIDLPGVNRKDLHLEVAGDQLRVSGDIVEKEKVGWLRHRTRTVGRFQYQTLLPGGVDVEHVTADLADGLLTVRLPKTEAAKPRRITVNAG
ncbi:Hsp20/alpha crystallin family protein [Dactylosporangium matsuzakiense]|uniref:Hsp20/alpha crystallin family protein n=2 Tax=Dactylosporangium matsuzakiense TaxID=53360 RepID=A0A9W6KT55_9ACTN|nr:Hsp20/alpha crystallin family protein [Dactylosporangium matsuzakiense]